MRNTDKLHEQAASVSRLLKQMAHPDRLKILCRLAEGEASVNALVSDLHANQSWVSQILQRLRNEGLIESRKEGLFVYYRLENPALIELMAVLVSLFCKKTKGVNK